jgi:hypothetical protein
MNYDGRNAVLKSFVYITREQKTRIIMKYDSTTIFTLHNKKIHSAVHSNSLLSAGTPGATSL